MFAGRLSLNAKQARSLFEYIRPKPETRNFACQAEIADNNVLHKASLNIMTTREKNLDKAI